MAPNGETRIQLCGRLVVKLEGRCVDDALRGALGHAVRLPRAQPASSDRSCRAHGGRLGRGGGGVGDPAVRRRS